MTHSELMTLLDGMVKNAQASKHTKRADEAGPTAHPIGNVDDGTVAADEGEHGREKSQDVKDAIPAESVEDSGDLVGDASPKGDVVPKYDAEEEPDKSTKDTKDDPGTSSPFKVAEDKMKNLLASIAVYKAAAADETDEKGETKTPAVSKKEVVETKLDTMNTDKTKEAKDEALGRAVGNALIDSVSEDATVIQQIQKKASEDIQGVAEFLFGFNKAANELPPEVAAELLASTGGEEESVGAPGEGDVPPEELQAMLGGAGDMGAGDMGAGDMGAGDMGEEAGGLDAEQALEELAIALDEAGITPEELVELATEGAGEEGLGEAPMEEAPMEEAPAEAPVEEVLEEKPASDNSKKLAEILKAASVLQKYNK